MTHSEIYAEIKKRGGKADLSTRAKFELSGEDRVRFLNGQVSNDVRRASSETLYACVMTAKGKMSGDIFVYSRWDKLHLDAEPTLRESLPARLERYIISDDVTLTDVTDELGHIHLFGSPSPGIPIPDPVVRSRRFGIEGFDLRMPRDMFAVTWSSLAAIPTAGEEMLEVLRVEAGVPRWGRELTEDTIPVEAGLDKTAIDYEKGCYVGQEIISRLKSVGHVNKRLRGFVEIAGVPEAGMRLFTKGQPEKEAGWLTSAVHSFGLERHAALGYLKRGVEDRLLTARHPGREESACLLEVRDLPLIP